MKRIVTNQWRENFTDSQHELIHQALCFPLESSLASEDVEARNNIANILNHINVDHQVIVAAILLVGLEHKAFNLDDVNSTFEPSVVNLTRESILLVAEEKVWLEKLPTDFTESDVSSHHMMLLGIMKDARTVFILLAKQLLRLQQLVNEDRDTQIHVAKETRYIFSPLANRLGIGQLKWELEDLAFRYLQPDDYKSVAKALEERRVDREQYMSSIVSELQSVLDEAKIFANVYGRPKHIYSIWRKMQSKRLQFADLFDVRAMRVMVEDISACYSVLSIVHELWEFIPQEYDDYIAAPKNNNYQSLHTAVVGPEGKIVEIQIRTQEMHEHAELGVAAHWRYKEGGSYDEELERHIELLRSALSDERSDDEVSTLNASTGMKARIYVLSPKGNVVELPVGATPLDFAYHIHTDVGHRCRGALVNEKMVSLTTPLLSGQTVEIITAKNATPSRDWLIPHLGYLKSSRSRAKVKQWFKREFREEHIALGKSTMAKEVTILPSNTALQSLMKTFNLVHIDDLYAAIGRGDLGVQQVLNTLKVPEQKIKPAPFPSHVTEDDKRTNSPVVIEGVDAMLSSLAKCCKPMKGDEVIGFITKGRGVTIHRLDCLNIAEMKRRYPERFMPVNWSEDEDGLYELDIEVQAMDRPGLLRDVSALLAGENVNVCRANTHSNKVLQQARMRLTVEMNNISRLPNVLSKLHGLRGVFEAVRVK